MAGERPSLIAIDNDDYHAEHVGKTAAGIQFFLTTPFVPEMPNNPGCEYVALYMFGADGSLAHAAIESFGPRSTMDSDSRREVYDAMLNGLGNVEFCRIEVAPFVVERFGVQFGLIIREPEDADDIYCVEAQPGNYMAFFEPWDSGEYDT
jgi:hypothetical protein